MATRTVISREAAKALREGAYTDAQLQGVILELAETHAKQLRYFRIVLIVLAVIVGGMGVAALSRPGLTFEVILQSIMSLLLLYAFFAFYTKWRVTDALKRGFLRNLRKGYPDQYEHYKDLFQEYVNEARMN